MLISFTIEGVSPLLCNRFTDADELAVEGGTSAAIRGKKPAPREAAEAKLYRDSNGRPVLPGTNLMRAVIDAGTFVKNGKTKLTTMRSSIIPAGMSIDELELPIAPAQWEVDRRSVVIPSTGGRVMAYRPRFDAWKMSGTLVVDDALFSAALARELFDLAGQRIGVGDYRPARKGPFGRFKVTAWKIR